MTKLKDGGYVVENEKTYTLTEDGVFWGNNISREVLVRLVEGTLEK